MGALRNDPTLVAQILKIQRRHMEAEMPIVNRKNIFTTGFDQDALIITKPGTNLLNLGDLTTTGDLADGMGEELELREWYRPAIHFQSRRRH